jgi:glycosyltransferase involved in cell wall biosynthesis
MRAWQLKQSVRRLVVDGPLRPLAAPIYELAVRGALAIDLRLPAAAPDRSLDGQLTALVKTFERPAVLRRLIASIRRTYPSLPVIVVDDSETPSTLPGVETVVLPFDSGVSAGRQAGLDRVRTPYVLVLDDDFVFLRDTALAPSLAWLAKNPNVDILGGQLIDVPLLRRRPPPLGQIFATPVRPIVPIGSSIDGLLVCDKVANFYLARTERLRLVGWDAALRRIDHADFFTRALGVLVTVFDERLRCIHAQTPFDARYMAHRLDHERDRALLAARWGVRHAVR